MGLAEEERDQRGQTADEAWREACPGYTPPWIELPDRERETWRAAAATLHTRWGWKKCPRCPLDERRL